MSPPLRLALTSPLRLALASTDARAHDAVLDHLRHAAIGAGWILDGVAAPQSPLQRAPDRARGSCSVGSQGTAAAELSEADGFAGDHQGAGAVATDGVDALVVVHAPLAEAEAEAEAVAVALAEVAADRSGRPVVIWDPQHGAVTPTSAVRAVLRQEGAVDAAGVRGNLGRDGSCAMAALFQVAQTVRAVRLGWSLAA